MRILITLPWGERLGGSEVMLQTVLDGAHESAHELELVFLEPGPWPNELAQDGFRVEVIAAGRVRQAGQLLASVVRLARIFHRRQPDLIVNWIAKAQLYCSPAALLAGMSDRVIWWQHDTAAGYWLDRIATALPAIAVGCSSRASARAQAQLFPHRPTFAVAPGTRIPDGNSPLPQLALPADVPVVGLVGRLQPWKGQDRLLHAQALLRERGRRIHTLIVGGDAHGLSSQYAASLQPLISHLGLNEHVTMTGQVADAGPYIDQMDVLVNASDPEPFGIVLLEAMARSVAVVAVGSGGPAEFIADGRTGLFARSGEPAALADALDPLIASAALRRELARAGHERFLEDFTDLAMRRRFFEQMQALADTHRPLEQVAATTPAAGRKPR
jgi:glycosyltransferase involved in cell wall biosynthesis